MNSLLWRQSSPELRRRVKNLMRRGFDVPPSKEEQFAAYIKAGYTVKEAGEAMGLE